MAAALFAAAIVFVVHYGVNWWADMFARPDEAYRWIQYVGRAPEVIVFATVTLFTVRSWPEPWRTLLCLAAIIAIMEESEIGICGTALFGTQASSLKLCTQAFGPWPNLIGAATALTILIVMGRRRHETEAPA